MDNAIYDPLKRQFGFEEWRGRNTLSESLLIWRFYQGEDDFPGWKPIRIQTVQAPGWPQAIQSAWQPVEGAEESLLTVNVYELEGRPEAHEFLIRLLGDFQSREVSRKEQGYAGDVAFAPPEDNALLFARANLAVLLQNGGRKVLPLASLASHLDEELSSRPQPAEGQVAPQIRRFTAGAERAKIGEQVPLEVEAIDPLGRSVWFKLFSPAGEIRLVEGRPVYIPSAAGEQRITLYALNPNRAAARQEVTLVVE